MARPRRFFRVAPVSPQHSPTPRPVVVASQLLIFVLICVILYWGKFLLVPVTLAIFCAFVIHPPLRWLEKHGFKRGVTVGLMMAVTLSIVGSLGWVFTQQLTGLLSDIPSYRENIKEKIVGVKGMTTGSTISKGWKSHLERGGLDIPLLVFTWNVDEGVRYSESALRDAGAAEIVRGVDQLEEWLRTRNGTLNDSSSEDHGPEDGVVPASALS